MSEELRAEIAALAEVVHVGFARMDRYFELQQAQFLDWRRELRGEVGELRELLVALTNRVDRLEFRMTAVEYSVQRLDNEVRLLRDSVGREFAAVRSELRELRRDVADRDAVLHAEVAALESRVSRLEERLDGGQG